jgi:hypothetical protein
MKKKTEMVMIMTNNDKTEIEKIKTKMEAMQSC